jgi:hypothetical protein
VPYAIFVEVDAPELIDGSDSIFPVVLDPIESPFQFPAAILFRLGKITMTAMRPLSREGS